MTYLNSCSQGALAIPVRSALDEYLDGMYERGSLWDKWVMKQGELRQLVAQVFKTAPSNVAITSNASAGINSVLSALDFSGLKNRIVTTDLEFPTMGQILHAQELRGAEVIHVAADPDGILPLERLEAALDDRVALVAVTHVCYRTGAMSDIKAASQLCHKYGIPTIVDAYQSAGSIPIDFDDIGADFMVGGFLKYTLGLPGIGFLLVKSDYSSVPTQTGWFAARDVFAMKTDEYDPATDARRFEGGTPPIPSVFAAVAGLKLLLEVGLEESWSQTSFIHQLLRQELVSLGASVLTPEDSISHAGMIAFKSMDENKLVSALELDQVIVSSRDGNLRVSPHFYNDESDVAFFIKALTDHRSLFAPSSIS